MRFASRLAGMMVALASAWPAGAHAGELQFGKPGEPVDLVVGYQPYYTEAWSGVVMRGKRFFEKYLPKGSKVEFQVGLQGAIVVNNMLAGKQHIGYVGDMPAITATTKAETADLRIVATTGLGHDQCNVFLVRNDAPAFATAQDALRWTHGKQVAVPKGSCTDRFAQATFQKLHVQPAEYLNQNIEVITSNFRAGKIDAAVVWEPTASRLALEGLARRVASGASFDETDGGFLVFRADLLKQRPDIVKAWLQAELDAQQFLADEANATEIVKLAKAQTTGFSERTLWTALYGEYSAQVGGQKTRLQLPFTITPEVRAHLERATAFLYSVKSINTAKLRAEAIVGELAEQVLRERQRVSPLGEVSALPAAQAPNP